MSVIDDSPARAVDTGAADQRAVPTPAPPGRWAWEWIKSFLIALVLFLVIRTFLIEAFRIPTGSMESTLLAGDFLLVNKVIFGVTVPLTPVRTPALADPGRGDIVVFEPPHDPGTNYVKRIVAAAGDTVEMQAKVLMVNGIRQVEPFARYDDPIDIYASGMFWQCEHAPYPASAETCRPTRDNWGPVIVPHDHYFMLGDNRDDSEDSRYWGFVPRAALRGRPLFIYFSHDPSASRATPMLDRVRWSRIAQPVH